MNQVLFNLIIYFTTRYHQSQKDSKDYETKLDHLIQTVQPKNFSIIKSGLLENNSKNYRFANSLLVHKNSSTEISNQAHAKNVKLINDYAFKLGQAHDTKQQCRVTLYYLIGIALLKKGNMKDANLTEQLLDNKDFEIKKKLHEKLMSAKNSNLELLVNTELQTNFKYDPNANKDETYKKFAKLFELISDFREKELKKVALKWFLDYLDFFEKNGSNQQIDSHLDIVINILVEDDLELCSNKELRGTLVLVGGLIAIAASIASFIFLPNVFILGTFLVGLGVGAILLGGLDIFKMRHKVNTIENFRLFKPSPEQITNLDSAENNLQNIRM